MQHERARVGAKFRDDERTLCATSPLMYIAGETVELGDGDGAAKRDRRIVFRIGIHLGDGDVVEESDGDLMGDGVNIAARLEGGSIRHALFI